MHRITAAFMSACLGLATVSFAQAAAPVQPAVIVTQAEGVVKRSADRAWIAVAVETRNLKADDARRRNAEVMTSLQAGLRAVGLAADAIRTTGYTLGPEFEWNNGRSTLKGYVARNQVDVRIDDLDKVGDVIDAANSPRGVALSINGPRFELKDREGAEHEALALAVRQALGRAQAMAAGAGRAMGAILRIDEQQGGPIAPQPMFRAAVSTASAPGNADHTRRD